MELGGYEISIIADNNCSLSGYKEIFGFSILVHIKQSDKFILVDTGSDNIPDAIYNPEEENQFLYNRVEDEESWFLSNLYQKLPKHISGSKIINLDGVFISHNHWDHTGELEKVVRLYLEECRRTNFHKKLSIYVDKQEIENGIRRIAKVDVNEVEYQSKVSFKELKSIEMEILGANDIIEIIGISEEITKISNGIYSSGMMESDDKAKEVGVFVREQALFLQLENQDFIIISCDAHTGIKNLRSIAEKFGNVKALFGCLYLFHEGELDYLKGIEKLYLGHWTGIMDKIKQKYPESFKLICTGETINY